MYILIPMNVSMILQSPRWWIYCVGAFILRGVYVAPNMRKFCYANGDSPYTKFPAFLPVHIWGLPVCVPGSVCDVSAIFPHTISLCIRGSPFANFVLISAALHTFSARMHTGIPICKCCTNFCCMSRRMHTGIPICNNLSIFSNSLDDF
jgi:hypothetical protein